MLNLKMIVIQRHERSAVHRQK